ncbi:MULTISPECIES: hypothetical protein [Clostridium]|uniref:hypothetical protein n=1 Tax=Clostridium TaxID=1485 RepID=UPI0015E16656|nr:MULTISPECIES: hypothetical protein [Clostridium]MBN7575424.1 hypothetical protein [Clostridium beijerinckii]MBN7580735.1 hypothetical protein [Clostridium beijerinckii]MBN7585188.1 hypothetical protein [Clostridium beijerinckii]MBO0522006.1 hypothetical protein [Clostridium beijerinckii]
MIIEKILKERDPKTYKKLDAIKKKEKLSERDIKELMSHSSYKRHKGAIKQVK